MPQKYSFPKSKIKILLVEGIHSVALDTFKAGGYAAESVAKAPNEKELLDLVPAAHILGIRSRTQVTEKILKAAPRLLAVGCFCIGTDQVDLKAAVALGIPVFNAPFSNTRSVAELALAEVIMLARKAATKSAELHLGIWDKSAVSCYEVRNKTIGIVGYGHIGQQIGLLAEAVGMRVLFFDIVKKLPLGNAQELPSLDDLLRRSDFVTLHVPETAETRGMIGERELGLMQKGSYLLNLSRGSVVRIPALAEKLKSGHLAGAALDVFPKEPSSNSERFESELCGLPNVILTPHIGGSTIEAQHNIGIEVASSLRKYIDTGSSTGSVNFPNVELPQQQNTHRVLNIHRNIPGVLSKINRIVADMGANIQAQFLSTLNEIGYLIMDVGPELSSEVKDRIEQLDENIKTRLLF